MAHPPPPPAEPMKVPSPAPEAPKPSTGYDSAPPQALLDFMVQRWRPASGKAPRPLPHHAAFAARRRALSQLFPGETLVVPTGHEKVRANDTDYRFRPGSDFYYLTGNLEPDCVLVMRTRSRRRAPRRALRRAQPRPDRLHLLHRPHQGRALGGPAPRRAAEPRRASASTRRARCPSSRPPCLSAGAATRPWRVLRGISRTVDAALPDQGARDKELRHRALRDAPLQGRAGGPRALRGHRLDQARLRGRHPPAARRADEREVEGVFNLRARVEGNDVGYGTIAAAGAHACILHWTRNDGALRTGDLLLLDAGVEGTHASTPPTSPAPCPSPGSFSREQRQIYELVHDAQAAAFAAVQPGQRLHGAEPRGDDGARRGARGARHPRGPRTRRWPTRTSSTSATRSTTSATCSASTCTTAPRRAQEAYKFGKLEAGHGAHRRARPLLPDGRPHRAGAVPRHRRAHRGRRPGDRQGRAQPLRGTFPSEAGEVEAWMSKVWKSRR